MLLDRLDELPLRRHEIRGNPAGLLARLLERIDALKAEAVTAALPAWAREREREARARAERERAPRELEFAELYARHDASCASRQPRRRRPGARAARLLRRPRRRPRERLAERFPR